MGGPSLRVLIGIRQKYLFQFQGIFERPASARASIPLVRGDAFAQSGANAETEGKMAGFLTTHVLDTARGLPAQGLTITLYRLDRGARVELARKVTNDDGRTDGPILPADDFAVGQYELVFAAGDYLRATGQSGDAPLFLDEVPIRFGINDPASHYHVPLLLSPYGYSTYRGS
jgi:5-hydroxyisourate hydrolase